MHRVVITGIGAVTPLGPNAADSWRAMREGRVAIGPITSLPRESLRFGIAAEVRDFDPAAHFDDKRLPCSIAYRSSRWSPRAKRWPSPASISPRMASARTPRS